MANGLRHQRLSLALLEVPSVARGLLGWSGMVGQDRCCTGRLLGLDVAAGALSLGRNGLATSSKPLNNHRRRFARQKRCGELGLQCSVSYRRRAAQ